jgi:acetyltransferase-like isoleucine patch superfamily enzyme
VGEGARIFEGACISLGSEVHIGQRARIQGIRTACGDHFDPYIEIGDRVSAEDGLHIGAIGRVLIGDDVLIASNVLIIDHSHRYDDPALPVARQPLTGGGLRIGAGSHLGEQASILGPLEIGEHVIVGAHAVVTTDVPPYTVVVGIPARPIRRWVGGRWERL